jgi:VIT1/CCC1 family predicted Fe2+/Mn2+ transporter
VGGSYFAGAMVPLLPVFFGAKNAVFSLFMAGSVVIVVSMVLAFLSGMDIKKRIATNLLIITGAVSLTYAIGLVAKQVWRISL